MIANPILRLGSGAGYSGDRIEPALQLIEEGRLDYIIFECLAERTIALAQQRRLNDPETGYDPRLAERMRKCLPACVAKDVKLISNMGAANPLAAMRVTAKIAAELGISGLRIAAVTGDDLWPSLDLSQYSTMEGDQPLSELKNNIVSANAYLGAGPIVEALKRNADIILTGRVADPALFIAPAVHEYGWSMDDWNLLGQATVMGHLMECAGQVTGGYYADPGYKEVPKLDRLGFPIAEVGPDGSFVITKLPKAGGMVTLGTCTEQLLYEIHDPAHYATPDVIADFSNVTMEVEAKDRIRVRGGRGRPKSGMLKVSVGYRDGFIGEGQISYGGPGAAKRAELALSIVKERLQSRGFLQEDLRYDLIGMNSLYQATLAAENSPEVRLRVAARAEDRQRAQSVADEVETLYTNGPAGGGGATKSIQELIAVQSILIDANDVRPQIEIIESKK